MSYLNLIYLFIIIGIGYTYYRIRNNKTREAFSSLDRDPPYYFESELPTKPKSRCDRDISNNQNNPKIVPTRPPKNQKCKKQGEIDIIIDPPSCKINSESKYIKDEQGDTDEYISDERSHDTENILPNIEITPSLSTPKPTCQKYMVPKKCHHKKPTSECKDEIIVSCDTSTEEPIAAENSNITCRNCMCPNYPDMSKYMLKSKIPPPHDINKIVKEKIENIPKLDYSKYILKSKISSCSPPADLSKYVLKASVPPSCKNCLDKPCEAEMQIRREPIKVSPKICCPARPRIILQHDTPKKIKKTSNCCSCQIQSEEEESMITMGETIDINDEMGLYPEEESSVYPSKKPYFINKPRMEDEDDTYHEETHYLEEVDIGPTIINNQNINNSTNIDDKITSEINNTIQTYAKNSILTASSNGCAPFFDNSKQSDEPMGIISGTLFK